MLLWGMLRHVSVGIGTSFRDRLTDQDLRLPSFHSGLFPPRLYPEDGTCGGMGRSGSSGPGSRSTAQGPESSWTETVVQAPPDGDHCTREAGCP